jgi:exonuclease III
MWLKNKKADIIFLQETYSTSEVENIWKTQWKGKVFYSHGTTHSRGTMILISGDLEFELMNIYTDTNGRYIFLEAMVQGCRLLLVNIYAPNTRNQQENFFSLLSNKMDEYDFQPERNIIMAGGDFNIYFDVDMHGLPWGQPSIKKHLY